MTSISQSTEASTGAPVVRGLPTRRTDLMEMFEFSVVQAFAAAAGCNVSEPRIDNGIDLDIYHEMPNEDDATLRVQLKAVSSGWNASRSRISARLSRLRYDKMRRVGTQIPSLVIIMDLPADMSEWTWSKHPYTALRHCCYWVSLEGQPERAGAEVTVSAPATNVFDDEALCRIMARIRAGGRP